jgi:hypothetical protein
MASSANFLVDLVSTLKLSKIPTAKGAIEGVVYLLGLEVEFILREC